MRHLLPKSLLSLTCALALDGLFGLSPSALARDEATVSIHNTTNSRLFIRAMGRVDIGQIAPGRWMHITLPKKFRYKNISYTTRQFMAYGGGSWQADSSGWTRYRNLKTCTKRIFNHKSGANKWVISQMTGVEKKCEPLGYHQ